LYGTTTLVEPTGEIAIGEGDTEVKRTMAKRDK
jgi:hypothetical protein